MKSVIIVLIILGLLVIAGAAFYLNQGSDVVQTPKTEIDVMKKGNIEPPKIAEGKVYKVEIKDFKLPDLTINVGDTIEWTNEDSAPHTATADNKFFDTDRLEEGDSHKITFNKPGTFSYYCSIHPYMKGTVVVREAGS